MLENIYQKIDIIEPIKQDIADGRKVQITGCVPSQMEHLIAGICGEVKQRIIVAVDEQKAMEILENCLAYGRDAVYYPARDPMFYKADIRGNYISGQRIEVVKRIFNDESLTIITCPEAFTDTLADAKEVKALNITIRKNDQLDVQELA